MEQGKIPKDDPKGSFIRWQSITIGQLTYATNLILGFSVAALGFQITLLLNEKFAPVGCWQKSAFLISLALLALSTVFGILLVINRLKDFRETMRAARKREEKASAEEIEPHRVLYRKLGKTTWCLFGWQIRTFGVGIVIAVLSVVASSVHKIF